MGQASLGFQKQEEQEVYVSNQSTKQKIEQQRAVFSEKQIFKNCRLYLNKTLNNLLKFKK